MKTFNLKFPALLLAILLGCEDQSIPPKLTNLDYVELKEVVQSDSNLEAFVDAVKQNNAQFMINVSELPTLGRHKAIYLIQNIKVLMN